jgi:hypothetical protein
MLVFSAFFAPLEASADLPSLACVGFLLMLPSSVFSWLGIVKKLSSNCALMIDSRDDNGVQIGRGVRAEIDPADYLGTFAKKKH